MAEVVTPIQADGRSLSRGNLMRGWRTVLREEGLLDAVLDRLTPEVQALLTDPPAPTAWVDMAFFECVAEAVRLQVGERRLDQLFVSASRTSLVALLSRWGSGIVKVFGATPHSVLGHAKTVANANTVGFALEYANLGERQGELAAHYPFRPAIHKGAAWGTSAACQLAAEVAGVTLIRSAPRIESSAVMGTKVLVRISW